MLVVIACLSSGPATALPVSVKTIGTEAEAGALQSFSLDGGLRWIDSSGSEQVVAPADVVQISTATESATSLSEGVAVHLTGGGVLYGNIVSGTEEIVRIAPQGFGPVEVPLAEVTGLATFVGRLLPSGGQAAANVLPDVSGPDDVLLLGNGDRISGAVVRISEQGVTFDTDAGVSTVPFERLLGAILEPLAAERPDRLRARVLLADGSRLEAQSLQWTTKSLRARFYSETQHEVPLDAVVRVEVVGGRWQWLSELDPVSFAHTPFLTLDWPWQRDRNVRGGPVRVGGTHFERGIGVHSQSRLVYETGGDFAVFFSHFGLDDTAGPLADVDIEIRVDGQTRFHRKHIKHRPPDQHEPGDPIRIELDGAKRLELIVTFGQNGDVQDRFNWAGAALIR